jgi:hypothetical protein
MTRKAGTKRARRAAAALLACYRRLRLPWKVAVAVAVAVLGYLVGKFLLLLAVSLLMFACVTLSVVLLPVLGIMALAGAGKRQSRHSDEQWNEDNDPRKRGPRSCGGVHLWDSEDRPRRMPGGGIGGAVWLGAAGGRASTSGLRCCCPRSLEVCATFASEYRCRRFRVARVAAGPARPRLGVPCPAVPESPVSWGAFAPGGGHGTGPRSTGVVRGQGGTRCRNRRRAPLRRRDVDHFRSAARGASGTRPGVGGAPHAVSMGGHCVG